MRRAAGWNRTGGGEGGEEGRRKGDILNHTQLAPPTDSFRKPAYPPTPY